MEEIGENQLNNRDKTGKDPVTGRFVEGNEYGKGRPPGSRNFETDFDEVIEEIAKANNITNSEARKILIKKAYSEAKNGNYNFYRDINDRVYGKVVERTDLTTKGEKIVITFD